MRRPIAVQVPLFNVNDVQGEIDAICADFARYLSFLPSQGGTSKHSVMGPVGKIISEVKSGRDDRASLKGYALRVHEAKEQFPQLDAVVALDSGIEKLVDLLTREDVPLIARDRILDRIDYGLYYLRRRQQIEGRERYNEGFRDFLRHRYGSLESLAGAWGDQIESWDRVYAFGSQSRTYSRANVSKQKDADEFRQEWRRTAMETDIDVADEEEAV